VTHLIRSELLKLRTTQVWFWLLLSNVAIGALVAVGSLASEGTVTSAADVPDIFASANGVLLITFVLGVLGVTTEFRYQTITPTVLGTPSRWAIVWAKMITYGLAAVGYAVACLGVQLAITLPWLAAKDITLDWSDPDLLRAIFGFVLVVVLFAIMGIGIGAMLRNQVLAVTLGLVFMLIIQNLIGAIPKVYNVWPYTPAGATTAILFGTDQTGPNDIALLSPAAGVVVLLLWAFIPAIIGASVTLTRDIT
jgi:ABC-2 type transport system permease protein